MKRLPRLASTLALAASLLLVPNSHAQSPTPAAATEPAKGRIHSLKLTVVDATTKQPVAGAEVMSWEARDMVKVTTDAAGTATLNVPVDAPFGDRQQRFETMVNDPRYAHRYVTWIATAGHVRETLPAEYEIQVSPGITAGGVVRDEHDAPIAGATITIFGSDYKGFSLRPGDDTKSHQEFSGVQTDEKNPILTNEQGAWRVAHFPAELGQISIEVIRPGGARARFTSDARFRSSTDHTPVLDLAAVKAGNAVLTVKDGQTVSGIVIDEAGQPINGVQLRARDATSRYRPYVFTNEFDGKFDLLHWDATSVLVSAERAGYRGKTITIPVVTDRVPAKIVLAPAKPLRLRIVGDNDTPIANAEIQTAPNPSDQILDWKATTDAEGRVAWDTAPDATVNIWIAPKMPSDYPYRQVKLLADGAEHVIRLRKGADKSIAVHLHVIDAESAAPIPAFEVWRRMPNSPFKPWGEPAEKGEFNQQLAAAEMPNGYMPSYRLQVRAAGYTGWSSETLDFANGDQDLTKGESTLANEPPPLQRPGQGISGETNPALLALAANVSRLLETGDVMAFVEATNASEADWAGLIPKSVDPKEGPLGADPARTIQRRAKALTASATHVLELAQRAGIAPGKVKFQVKSISSPMNATSGYKIGGQTLTVPYAMALRVVLAGEPAGDTGGKPLRGDYELSIGNSHQLPAGWRSEEGVRWTAFPAGLVEEATLRELRLTNLATPATFSDQRTLSGADDPALLTFGSKVTELVRNRGVPAFLDRVMLPRDEMLELYRRFGWGSAAQADEGRAALIPALTANVQAMLDLQNRIGVDLSDAKLTVKQMLVERPRFTRFGDADGLRGGPVRLTFAVESSHTAKSGRTIAGNYVVTLGDAVRINDRWVMIDDKIRWQEFPRGLVTDDELKHVEFENYVAENGTLPLGYATPDIEMVRLADDTRASLSAYRGKVVVLEFWATWCGPCQEPMEKLQHLREAHPDWKDRVEVIALSIDDKAVEARDHLAKKGWTKTSNVWAGDGGWASGPAKEFRVRGVPTAYVIGSDGKVVKAGHPMSMDFGGIVDAQLRQPPR